MCCVWPRYNSIWKRFTTCDELIILDLKLCLTKVQFNLKAIHNRKLWTYRDNHVVSDQGTIQFESDSQLFFRIIKWINVVSDQGTIQFESDSQLLWSKNKLLNRCVWPRYNSIWKRFTTQRGISISTAGLCLTKVQFNLFTSLIFNKGVHDPSGIESLHFDPDSIFYEWFFD